MQTVNRAWSWIKQAWIKYYIGEFCRDFTLNLLAIVWTLLQVVVFIALAFVFVFNLLLSIGNGDD